MTDERTRRSIAEIVRLCDVAARLASRGEGWYTSDPDGVPGLACESLIVKIGENVARVSADHQAAHPQVPWSAIKRMRDRLAHHYEGTDYAVVWATITSDLPVLRELIGESHP